MKIHIAQRHLQEMQKLIKGYTSMHLGGAHHAKESGHFQLRGILINEIYASNFFPNHQNLPVQFTDEGFRVLLYRYLGYPTNEGMSTSSKSRIDRDYLMSIARTPGDCLLQFTSDVLSSDGLVTLIDHISLIGLAYPMCVLILRYWELESELYASYLWGNY